MLVHYKMMARKQSVVTYILRTNGGKIVILVFGLTFLINMFHSPLIKVEQWAPLQQVSGGSDHQELGNTIFEFKSKLDKIYRTTTFFGNSNQLVKQVRQEKEDDSEISEFKSKLRQIYGTPFVSNNNNQQQDKEALHFFGERTRLEHIILKKLLSSKDQNVTPLRVVAIGGSTTACHGVKCHECYPNLFTGWLETALKPFGVHVSLQNAAIGGSTSNYFNLCIEEHVNLNEIDILLVDFVINESLAAFWGLAEHVANDSHPMEQLIRIIYRKNPMIDIIFVNFHYKLSAFKYPQMCQSLPDFHYYDQIAERYNLTSIGFKHLLCNSETATFSQARLDEMAKVYLSSMDGSHPGSLMHRLAAANLVDYIKTSIQQLLSRLSPAKWTMSMSQRTSEMAASINQQTLSLVSQQTKTLYNTTWLDAADCFVSIQRPFRNNSRLFDALKNVSSTGFFNDLVKFIDSDDNRLGSSEIKAQNFVSYFRITSEINSFMEFEFRSGFKSKLACSSGVYSPRIVVSYSMCRVCNKVQHGRAEITLIRNDGRQFEIQTEIVALVGVDHFSNFYFHPFTISQPTSSNATSTTTVDDTNYNILTQPISSCWSTDWDFLVKNLRVRFTQPNSLVTIHAVSVAYHCCIDNAIASFPSV